MRKPIKEICTEEEIKFNLTWYRAPIEVLMKFYFGKYDKEFNSDVLDELVELKESGKLKDSVDVASFEAIFYFLHKKRAVYLLEI